MNEGVISRLISRKDRGFGRREFGGGFFDNFVYGSDKKKIAIYVLIVVVVLVILYYFLFVRSIGCNSTECFFDSMADCKSARYLSDVEEATWKYTVKGRENGLCRVDVELYQAKEGSLQLDKLRGKEMSCFYPVGEREYPESDLTKCEGELKEELQGVMIQGLHKYILDNLDDIKDEITLS